MSTGEVTVLIVSKEQTREETILGFISGAQEGKHDRFPVPEQWIVEHLIEMGFKPKSRFRDEMRELRRRRLVERTKDGWFLTLKGAAYVVKKYRYGWMS